MTCYVRTHKNRKYANDSVVPFVGHYTDKQGNTQSRFMYIYEIHCIKTNQYYIGQHTCRRGCKDPLKELYKGSGSVITKLRHEFDWYNDFTFTILQFCDNNEQLAEAEYQITQQYRIRYASSLLNNHFYKQVIDYASHYIKEKKPVINLNTGEYFNSQTEAAAKYNVDPSSIVAAVKRKIKIGNCFWCLAKACANNDVRLQLLQQYNERLYHIDKQHCQTFTNAAKFRSSKKVICVETGQEYSSIRELARILNVNDQEVQYACAVGYSLQGKHYNVVQDNNVRGKKRSIEIINLTTGETLDNKLELAKRLKTKPSKVATCIKHIRPIDGNYWIFKTFLQYHTIEELRNIVSNVVMIRNHTTTRTPLTFIDCTGEKYTVKQLVAKHKMAPSNILYYALWSIPIDGCTYTLIDVL